MIQDIRKINRDPNFHGIAVHLPLPKSINPWDVLDNISVDKDVDAVTRKNLAEVERLG
jgi:5,10-methylene-tetrahydrofolate dehydrogenase/methenyl tetrahydrofolate cyclohydrolase